MSKRMQFGRKSEKLDRQIERLEAELDDLTAGRGAAEARDITAGRKDTGASTTSTERAASRQIQDSIESLPCLVEPGSGIMYTIPVERFAQIGKR